jgi:hypothetical protein
VGGEAGEGEENCPARVGTRPGEKVKNLKTFSKMSSFILEDFFGLELFLLGKKYDGQPGGGHEARNQV